MANNIDFEATYRQYFRQIEQYVGNIAPNPADAADITQETFLRLYRLLCDGAIEDTNLKGWLYRVANNLVRDQRKHVACPVHPTSLDSWEEDSFAYSNWNAIDTKLDIQTTLDRLPVHYRTVLYLYYYCDWTEQTIAKHGIGTLTIIHQRRRLGLLQFARLYLRKDWQLPKRRVGKKSKYRTQRTTHLRYIYARGGSTKNYQVAVRHPVTKVTHYLGTYQTEATAVAMRDRFCMEQGITL